MACQLRKYLRLMLFNKGAINADLFRLQLTLSRWRLFLEPVGRFDCTVSSKGEVSEICHLRFCSVKKVSRLDNLLL
jgi:hypothetical protein